MKKISAILIALVLSAVATVSVSAAGINKAEQSVINELKTTVTMKGKPMTVSNDYINQVENHFNSIEMTDDESTQIVSAIKEGKTYLESINVSNISDMSHSQKDKLLSYGQKAVGVIDMTMTFDNATETLTIKDKNGNVVFSAVPKLVAKDGASSNSDKDTVSDSNVIKTTGTNINTGAVAGATTVAVAVAGLGAACALKNKKERT
jgi:hypothetical protein